MTSALLGSPRIAKYNPASSQRAGEAAKGMSDRAIGIEAANRITAEDVSYGGRVEISGIVFSFR